MVKEAVVLAGGLGTRLRNVVKNLPKPMAPINDKPFLEYIFRYLKAQNMEKVVLAVGYKQDVIKNYFGKKYCGLSITYSEEKDLLGTGGAIKQAVRLIENSDVLILNGDTFFDVNVKSFYAFHTKKSSKLTIALKYMEHAGRYGFIEIDSNNRIKRFLEKRQAQSGLINGGVYLLDKDFLLSLKLPDKFSFEKDLLERYYKDFEFYGLEFDTYFIDIGIPEDYQRVQYDFKSFKY